MTHICVSKQSVIASDNGLSPGRRQSHYRNQCWNTVNSNLRNTFQWNLERNSNIFIQENVFESVVCEMASILSRPQCVKAMVSNRGQNVTMPQWVKVTLQARHSGHAYVRQMYSQIPQDVGNDHKGLPMVTYNIICLLIFSLLFCITGNVLCVGLWYHMTSEIMVL